MRSAAPMHPCRAHSNAPILHRGKGPSRRRETNYQRLESDREAVHIMTMHMAKGLEAGVVFLYGGCSAPSRLFRAHLLRQRQAIRLCRQAKPRPSRYKKGGGTRGRRRRSKALVRSPNPRQSTSLSPVLSRDPKGRQKRKGNDKGNLAIGLLPSAKPQTPTIGRSPAFRRAQSALRARANRLSHTKKNRIRTEIRKLSNGSRRPSSSSPSTKASSSKRSVSVTTDSSSRLTPG